MLLAPFTSVARAERKNDRSALDDLSHRLGEALGRADEDVHADLAALGGGRLVVGLVPAIVRAWRAKHHLEFVAERAEALLIVLTGGGLEPTEDESQVVVYVTAYTPTTVDEYARRLRPPREKRPR
jgi:hypothetical protein